MNSLQQEKKPLDYIQFIHNYLLQICKDSRLEGLVYHGGPEVKCKNKRCGVQTLCCVEYYNGDVMLEPTDKPKCICSKEYDLDYLPVRIN